ncbi:metal ABC transporter ATP-binding protein, partial [Desulfovibrio sp. 1214_IL3152]
AGVDVQGERLFWEVLDEARRQQGFTQLMVSHNLSLAAHYATHIICLNKRVCAEGAPHEALGASVLTQLFGMPIHLYPDQCAPDDPSCPQCGAVCAPERLLPEYASVKRREAAHQPPQASAAMHVPPDAVAEGSVRTAREGDHA